MQNRSALSTGPIIVDTNFLLTAIKFHINLSNEFFDKYKGQHRFLFLSAIHDELQILITRGIREARLGLSIIEKNAEFISTADYITKNNGLTVDEVILLFAQDHCAIIATNDRELKKKAMKIGIPIITLKQKACITLMCE